MTAPGARAPASIETPRLILREPVTADIPAIFHYASDPDVTRWMSWPRHITTADTQAFIDMTVAQRREWPASAYVILDKAGGQLLGATGLAFDQPQVAQTGYVLMKEAWGLGYATEALSAMTTLAPALGVERLYALCHVDHRASIRVLEKCGFELEGRFRQARMFPNFAPGQLLDEFCYSRVFTPRASGILTPS